MTAAISPPRIRTAPRDVPRLTQLAACAGCAAKLPQTVLADVLRRLPKFSPAHGVLVDASAFDDAGVFQLRPDLALVQTVDFFTPIVDDPYAFGQIASTNALSDVYAMGGRPVTAMNLLAVPEKAVGPAVIARILKGGGDKARQAGCPVVGGHTIKTAEPIYGLSVTGVVHPNKILTNAAARPGDWLVLTKPIGTGVATTGLKRGLVTEKLLRRATASMTRLNTPGADLAEAGLVQAATDVTGFGLTGHLANLLRASGVAAEITAADVPLLSPEVIRLIEQDCVPGGTRGNLNAADDFVDWGQASTAVRTVLADAQTSGPLLLAVAPKKLQRVLAVLKAHRTLSAAVIGRIVKGSPAIRVL